MSKKHKTLNIDLINSEELNVLNHSDQTENTSTDNVNDYIDNVFIVDVLPELKYEMMDYLNFYGVSLLKNFNDDEWRRFVKNSI